MDLAPLFRRVRIFGSRYGTLLGFMAVTFILCVFIFLFQNSDAESDGGVVGGVSSDPKMSLGDSGDDVEKVASEKRVVILGLKGENFAEPNQRDIYWSREQMEQVLTTSDKVIFLDTFRVEEKELVRVVTQSSHVILNDIVLRLICSCTDEEPLKSFGYVSPVLTTMLVDVNLRLMLLRKLLKRHRGVTGAFVGDIHAYSFGERGFHGAAACIHDLRLTSLLTFYLFTSDMLTLTTALMAYKRPVRVVWVPLHYGQPTSMPQLIPMQEREFDVFLYGADVGETYPFRRRLLQVLTLQKGMSYAVCKGSTGYGVIGDRRIELGDCSRQQLLRIIARSRLAVATPGRAMYMVMKYLEVPYGGAVPVGNIPMDARYLFEPNDMLVFRDYDSDFHILTQMSELVKDYERLEETVKTTRLRLFGKLGLHVYTDHVLDAVLQAPRDYRPIPRYLWRHLENLTLDHYAMSGTWHEIVYMLYELAGFPATTPTKK